MVDIQDSLDSAMSRLIDTADSRGSSGTDDSTLPTSPHCSDFDSSDMSSSQKSFRSNSSAGSLLNESLEFLENAWSTQHGYINGAGDVPGNGLFLPGRQEEEIYIPGLDRSQLLRNSSPLFDLSPRNLASWNLDSKKSKSTDSGDFPDSRNLIRDADGVNLDSLDRDLFRPISGTSSRQSTPRALSTPRSSGMPSPGVARMLRALARDADRVCSPDASTLYQARSQHYNPAGYGQHAYDECIEYRQWANSYLKYSPHQTSGIQDLPRDLADGITLLHLVEMLLGVSLDPIHVRPALEVQRTENIQVCLELLSMNGVNVDSISTEDIVKGNTKVVLAFCKLLRSHFGSSSGTPVVLKELTPQRRTSPSREQRLASLSLMQQPDHRTSLSPRRSTPSPFAVLDREDLALLNWVSNVTRTKVADYESFQDGHVLCLLINNLSAEDAIPNVVLEHGLPSEKISLALEVARDELNIEPGITNDELRTNPTPDGLVTLLKRLHRVFIGKLAKDQKQADLHMAREMLIKAKEVEKKDSEAEVLKRFQQKHERLKSGKLSSALASYPHTFTDSMDESIAKIRDRQDGLTTLDTDLQSDYFTSQFSMSDKDSGVERRNKVPASFSSKKGFNGDSFSSRQMIARGRDSIHKSGSSSSKSESNYFTENVQERNAPSLLAYGETDNSKNESRSNKIFLHDDEDDTRLEALLSGSAVSPLHSFYPEEYLDQRLDYQQNPQKHSLGINDADLYLKPSNQFSTFDKSEFSLYDHEPFMNPQPKEDKRSPSKLDVGLVPVPKLSFPKEPSVFDVETESMNPVATKSNKMEYENARVKLTEYNRQLELLKRQYREAMKNGFNEESQKNELNGTRQSFPSGLSPNMELSSMPSHMELPSVLSCDTSRDNENLSPDVDTHSPNKEITRARRQIKSPNMELPSMLSRNSSRDNENQSHDAHVHHPNKEISRTKCHIKSLSTGGVNTRYLQNYSKDDKGTFPPYRTWSLFVSNEVQNQQKSSGTKLVPSRTSLLKGKRSSSIDDMRAGDYSINHPASTQPSPRDINTDSSDTFVGRKWEGASYAPLSEYPVYNAPVDGHHVDNAPRGDNTAGHNGHVEHYELPNRPRTAPPSSRSFQADQLDPPSALGRKDVLSRDMDAQGDEGDDKINKATNRLQGLTAMIRLNAKRANAV